MGSDRRCIELCDSSSGAQSAATTVCAYDSALVDARAHEGALVRALQYSKVAAPQLSLSALFAQDAAGVSASVQAPSAPPFTGAGPKPA